MALNEIKVNNNQVAVVDNKPTNQSNNLITSGSVFELTITKSTAVQSSSGWNFNSITLTAGKTYFIKHVSGDKAGTLNIGSSIGPLTMYGKWVKYTAPETGHPYYYMGANNHRETPVIEVASEENLLIEDTINPIDDKVDTFGILKSTAIHMPTSSSWNFIDIYFVEGKKYYIKLVSGEGDNIVPGVANATGPTEGRLKMGEWVEYVSPASGVPFIYISGGSFTTAPLIMVTSEDNEQFNILLKVRKDVDKLLNLDLDTIKSTGVQNGAETAWLFSDVTLVAGKKYLVKVLGNGDSTTLNIGSSIGTNIYNGLWNEYTAPETGFPYFYMGAGLLINVPTILITSFDNVIVKDSIIPLEENQCVIESIATHDARSWIFRNFRFIEGESYYIKHIEGDLGTLAIGSSTGSPPLENGKWIEYVAPETGAPYLYKGAGYDFTNTPKIVVANKYIIQDIMSLQDNLEKTRIDSYLATPSGNNAAWMFGVTLEIGKKYYVRHISGDFGGSLNIGDAIGGAIEHGRWVEYTAPRTGKPYFFMGVGNLVNAPTIEIAQVVNILIKDTIMPLEQSKEGVKYTTINVSYDGTSETGRTIHFSGLTAIADAINSITDASESNRYIVHVEGEFHFTDPLTVPMLGGGEYSAILMKQWVDIEGDGPTKSVVFVDFPANATFHPGKVFNDYQPVYFYGVGGAIRNMKIAGKNCRYSFHIENGGSGGYDKTIDVEDCAIVSYGAPDYQGGMSCFGTGMSDGQTWNIKNCDIYDYIGTAFAMHTPLGLFERPANVNLINCRIMNGMYFGNYAVENFTFINMVNCTFIKGIIPEINFSYYNNRNCAIHGDYTTVIMNANKVKALYTVLYINQGKGCVLRVVSKSKGTTSKIRFGQSSSAFNSIIGDSAKTGKLNTLYDWDTQYGYVYRDGGVDLSGQAFGTLDIDENSSAGRTLGTLLGDCSTTNKQLVINVDGTNYTVTFNENYTDKSNAYVVGKINDVIGAVATADVYCPAYLNYPSINGLCNVNSVETGPILKGMGVVFTPEGMRKAKSSDGYIDGICLDNTSNGQMGRVITMGYIDYSGSSRITIFKTYDGLSSEPNYGQTLGIDPNIDGKFEVGVTPSILKYRGNGILEII